MSPVSLDGPVEPEQIQQDDKTIKREIKMEEQSTSGQRRLQVNLTRLPDYLITRAKDKSILVLQGHSSLDEILGLGLHSELDIKTEIKEEFTTEHQDFSVDCHHVLKNNDPNFGKDFQVEIKFERVDELTEVPPESGIHHDDHCDNEEDEEVDVESVDSATTHPAAAAHTTQPARHTRTKQRQLDVEIDVVSLGTTTQPLYSPSQTQTATRQTYRRTNKLPTREKSVKTPKKSRRKSKDLVQRSNHNVKERLRRTNLKKLFDALKTLLPKVRNKENASKALILREAATVCRMLRDSVKVQDFEREKLNKKKIVLVSKFKRLLLMVSASKRRY
ncbi:hypothetical protein O0L34_g16108 [Tuta absoluta]|nr:hypothetical protein O0L34_g16108 [Tuta absoluta]